MASAISGMDEQAKTITSSFIDSIFQDTWLLVLAIRNIPGVVVDKALYQHCLDMIEDVQKRLRNAGASEHLSEEIKFAHCVFLDEAVMIQKDVDSPETVLVNSGQTLHLQSQGETNIASGERISLNASQTISLLAQQEGIRMVSGKGPLTIESHGELMGLTALKDVTVQSTQGELHFAAKNGIVLGCGGASIRITPQGSIEIHTPGKLSLKGQHVWDAPASVKTQLPELPKWVCKVCLKKAQEAAATFAARG